MGTENNPHLLVFGPGYSAQAVIRHALAAGWAVSASYRRPEVAADLAAAGMAPIDMADEAGFRGAMTGRAPVSHILTGIAPTDEGDPALMVAKGWLRQQTGIRWIGYLSSTNVYGDHDGGWVDEETAPNPGLARGRRRVEAEAAWRMAANEIDAVLHVFRLAGIYGPGRNAIRALLDGRARRIVKAGQIFSRIHVADIGDAVWRAMNAGLGHEIFNLADDMPAPPGEPIDFAASLLGLSSPPEEDFETADLSPMARSFYLESKKVRNDYAKKKLGWKPLYPDYRRALIELLETEKARS